MPAHGKLSSMYVHPHQTRYPRHACWFRLHSSTLTVDSERHLLSRSVFSEARETILFLSLSSSGFFSGKRPSPNLFERLQLALIQMLGLTRPLDVVFKASLQICPVRRVQHCWHLWHVTSHFMLKNLSFSISPESKVHVHVFLYIFLYFVTMNMALARSA